MVVRPLFESDNAAEGDVPAHVERGAREGVASGVAVQHTADAIVPCLDDHREGVVFGFARMDDHRLFCFARQGQLRAKDRALYVAWRVIVVIVQAALAHGNSAAVHEATECVEIGVAGKVDGVMGMNTSRKEHNARMTAGEGFGGVRLADGGANADDGIGAGLAGSADYRVAVAGEGFVCEVGVGVDEGFHGVAARG